MRLSPEYSEALSICRHVIADHWENALYKTQDKTSPLFYLRYDGYDLERMAYTLVAGVIAAIAIYFLIAEPQGSWTQVTSGCITALASVYILRTFYLFARDHSQFYKDDKGDRLFLKGIISRLRENFNIVDSQNGLMEARELALAGRGLGTGQITSARLNNRPPVSDNVARLDYAATLLNP